MKRIPYLIETQLSDHKFDRFVGRVIACAVVSFSLALVLAIGFAWVTK